MWSKGQSQSRGQKVSKSVFACSNILSRDIVEGLELVLSDDLHLGCDVEES